MWRLRKKFWPGDGRRGGGAAQAVAPRGEAGKFNPLAGGEEAEEESGISEHDPLGAGGNPEPGNDSRMVSREAPPTTDDVSGTTSRVSGNDEASDRALQDQASRSDGELTSILDRSGFDGGEPDYATIGHHRGSVSSGKVSLLAAPRFPIAPPKLTFETFHGPDVSTSGGIAGGGPGGDVGHQEPLYSRVIKPPRLGATGVTKTQNGDSKQPEAPVTKETEDAVNGVSGEFLDGSTERDLALSISSFDDFLETFHILTTKDSGDPDSSAAAAASLPSLVVPGGDHATLRHPTDPESVALAGWYPQEESQENAPAEMDPGYDVIAVGGGDHESEEQWELGPLVRKKSVTFSESVQHFERPRSMQIPTDPRNTITTDLWNGTVKRPQPDNYVHVNGGHRIGNGVVRSSGDAQNNTAAPERIPMATTNLTSSSSYVTQDDDEIRVITEAAGLRNARQRSSTAEEYICVSSDEEADYNSDDEDIIHRKTLTSQRRLRNAKTVLLVITWLWMALTVEGTAPNLPLLAQLTGGSMETTARAFVARGAGALAGSVLTGLLYAYCPLADEIALPLGLTLVALTAPLHGWCARLAGLAVTWAAVGAGTAIIVVDTFITFTSQWEIRKAVYWIHLVYVMYGVGAAIVPVLNGYIETLPCNETLIWETLPWRPQNGGAASERHPSAIKMPFAAGNDTVAPTGDQFGNNTVDYETNVTTIVLPVTMAPVAEVAPWFPNLVLYFVLAALVGLCLALLSYLLCCHSCHQRRCVDRKLRHLKALRRKRLKKRISVVGLQEDSVVDTLLVASPNGNHVNQSNGHVMGGTTPSAIHRSDSVKSTASLASVQSERQMEKMMRYIDAVKSGRVESLKTTRHGAENAGSDVTRDEFRKSPAVINADKWFLNGQTFTVTKQMYLYVMFTLYGGLAVVYGQFLHSYAVTSSPPVGGHVAGLILTVYWAGVVVSRVVAVPVSTLAHPNAILVSCILTNTASSGILILYGHRFPSVLWLLAAMLGLSVGPMAPGGLTWANIYFHLGPRALALCHGFEALGVALFPWLSAFVVHSYGLRYMFVVTFAAGVVGLLLAIPVLVSLGKRNNFAFGMRHVSPAPTKTYL